MPGKNSCISVCQPWAWLLVTGHKAIENRSWQTNYRGELYIHASTTYRDMVPENEGFLIDNCPTLEKYLNSEAGYIPGLNSYDHLKRKKDWQSGAIFHFGAIIGRVNVIGCIEFEPRGVEVVDLRDFEKCARAVGFGDWYDRQVSQMKGMAPGSKPPGIWASGRYCWLIENAIKFATPIPYKGRLQIYLLPADVVKACEQATAEAIKLAASKGASEGAASNGPGKPPAGKRASKPAATAGK